MAWVLILYFGTSWGMTVPGIATREACEDLGKRLWHNAPQRCESYPLAKGEAK